VREDPADAVSPAGPGVALGPRERAGRRVRRRFYRRRGRQRLSRSDRKALPEHVRRRWSASSSPTRTRSL